MSNPLGRLAIRTVGLALLASQAALAQVRDRSRPRAPLASTEWPWRAPQVYWPPGIHPRDDPGEPMAYHSPMAGHGR